MRTIRRWIYEWALNHVLREHRKFVTFQGGIRLELYSKDLSKVRFEKCWFGASEMRYCDFRETDFRSSEFRKSNFNRASFVECKMADVDWTNTLMNVLLKKPGELLDNMRVVAAPTGIRTEIKHENASQETQ